MTIIAGYTPGPIGEAVVTHALAEAGRRNLPVIVVNTTRGDRLVDARYSQGDDWQGLVDRLEASGVPHEVRHFTSDTTPADDILTVAEEVDADLIVVGIRKRSAVGKLLLGSNAQRVVLEADCPVLAVKP